MKPTIIRLVIILCCGLVWAQNTPREPIQGTATNPVTQHEVDQSGEQKPLSELLKKKKRKPKTEVTAEPAKPEATTTPPTTTPQASPTSQDDSKTSTPIKN